MAEISPPELNQHALLVRVVYSTVNRTDCGFRSAQYLISRLFSGIFAPKHRVLGCEFSGKVIAVGSSVKAFKTGDRVFGYDDQYFGGHAEFKVIDEGAAVAHIPENMDYARAACLLEGSHYALSNIRSARVKPLHKVLVYGATGAIGSAAVQLLKHMGAYVVAVAGANQQERVRQLGADQVLDYTHQDYRKTSHSFDFIFDAVGKQSFRYCKPLLTPRGIYISTEPGRGYRNIFLALLTPLGRGKRVLFPLPTINKQDVIYLQELAETGAFCPLIDRTYALNAIVEAYRYVETGQKIGNVLLKIS